MGEEQRLKDKAQTTTFEPSGGAPAGEAGHVQRLPLARRVPWGLSARAPLLQHVFPRSLRLLLPVYCACIHRSVRSDWRAFGLIENGCRSMHGN
ncbi:hypothetical protein BT93_K1317 [Corymbia citriodora subsp. variegata]|nr:hypothetical protein BT93_K1317 [Corymbia citriodora subsp. variegata]